MKIGTEPTTTSVFAIGRTSLLLAALALVLAGCGSAHPGTGRRDLKVFVVLTSGDETFAPASREHAGAWVSAYGFAPGRVLYESKDGTRTLPQHLLIRPDGRTWYRYIAYLDSHEMRSLLEDFASSSRQPNLRELSGRSD